MVERTLPPRGMLALIFEMISFSWEVLSFPFETQVAFRREVQVEQDKEIGDTDAEVTVAKVRKRIRLDE